DRDLTRGHYLVRSRDGGVGGDLRNTADEEAALIVDDQGFLEEFVSPGFLRLQADHAGGARDNEGSGKQGPAEHETLLLEGRRLRPARARVKSIHQFSLKPPVTLIGRRDLNSDHGADDRGYGAVASIALLQDLTIGFSHPPAGRTMSSTSRGPHVPI